MVIEGRTATQVVTNMVSQTSGVLKAFGDAPKKIQDSGIQWGFNISKKFTIKTSYILTLYN